MRCLFLFFSIIGIFVTAACGPARPEQTANSAPAASAAASSNAAPEIGPVEEASGRSASLKCQETDAGKLKVFRKQTFAIDFEPFRGSCFVTIYDPEFGSDPPLASRFAVFKNGKQAFDFPSQFNGVTSGCWVEAVAFQDLNEDKLTDVIVVGKCSAKSAPYNENMVYVNNGSGFTTNEDANYQLADMTSIKAIADHAKENRLAFFKK